MKGYVISEEIGEINDVADNTQVAFWTKKGKWQIFKMPKSTGMKRRLLEMVSGNEKPKRLLVRLYDPDPVSRDIETFDFPLVASQWELAAEKGWIDNPKSSIYFRVINWKNEPLNLAIVMIGRPVYSPGESIRLTKDWGKHNNKPLIRRGTKGRIYSVSEDGKNYSVKVEEGIHGAGSYGGGIYGWLPEDSFRRTVFGL